MLSDSAAVDGALNTLHTPQHTAIYNTQYNALCITIIFTINLCGAEVVQCAVA